MSCVLSIAGKKFDIDEFVSKSKVKGFVKKYREQGVTSKSKAGKQYAFISKTVSEQGLNNFKEQVADATAYLKRNRNKLSYICDTKEIEFATLNFMVARKSVSPEYFAQYLYFPKELTIVCGSLNIGIEVSLV